jgi:hypothetical protein
MEFCNLTEDKGRGMVVHIRNNVKYSNVNIDSTFEEFLALDISTHDRANHVLLLVAYRSPNSSEDNNSALLTALSNLPHDRYTSLIVGDFNLPRINWDTWTTPGSADSKEFKFIEALRNNFLTQLVRQPTRFRGNEKPSLLDLIITNKEEVVRRITFQSGIGKSDHCLTKVELSREAHQAAITRDFRNFHKGNYNRLRGILDRDWARELNELDTVEDKWNHLLHKYNEAVERCIPLVKQRKYYKTALDPKIRKKIKEKDRLHHEVLRTHSNNALQKYRRVSNQVRYLTRKAAKNKEKRIAKESKENPKKFWKHVNSRLNRKSAIPDLRKVDGSLTSCDTEKASELGRYFASVFTDESATPRKKYLPSAK